MFTGGGGGEGGNLSVLFNTLFLCRDKERHVSRGAMGGSSDRSQGATCSSVVRAFAHVAIGRRINPSWGGPIELFLAPASAPRLVYQKPWYVLSCLWGGAYKRTLAANRKE